jgi:hypothetical protein
MVEGARGLDETPATKTKRHGRRPFHHLAAQESPFPASAGKDAKCISNPVPAARFLFASELCQATARKLPQKIRGAERREARSQPPHRRFG